MTQNLYTGVDFCFVLPQTEADFILLTSDMQFVVFFFWTDITENWLYTQFIILLKYLLRIIFYFIYL